MGRSSRALGVWLFSAHLNSYEIMPLYIACAGLPLFVLGRLQDGIARSYDWINLALMPPYVIRSLLLILAMGAAWWLKLPTDAATAMLAAVATTWVTVIGQTLVMNRRLAKKVEPGPRSYAAGAWLAASLPIFMVEGFYLLLTHADVLLLRMYRGPDEVAVYYAAAKTLALVAFVSFSVSAATAHKFSEYHVAGNKARALRVPVGLDQVDVLALARRDRRDPHVRQADPLAVRPADSSTAIS